MKNKKLIVVIIILIIGVFLVYQKFNKKPYEKTLFYMDTYIYVKIYSNDSSKANKALEEVEKIYSEYHKLTDRYNEYPNLVNIYKINNNVLKDEYLKIDEKLYKLIEYGVNLYNQSSGKIDISMGNVIDIWRGYRSSKIGIPTLEELKYVNYNKISDIELKDGNMIKNNNLNIDLGAIAKGYTTQKVGDYLNSINMNEYLINAGGNVLLGKHYKNDKYKVGLESPNNSGDVYKILKTTNKAIVTSGGYERYYTYEGKTYYHIIDPITLYPPDYMKSVSIITDDSAYADFLSTYLFLLPIEDGKKYVESLKNVEVVWYSNEDEIITTKGISKYE